jgi:hypothetical protein
VNVTGNFVVTLEAKQGHQGKEFSYARIYANWDTTNTVQQPMRARIAGRVTPSSTQSGYPSLEMIELPLKRNPSIIACCQVSKHINLTMKYAGKISGIICGIFTETWSGTKATLLIDPTLHVSWLHYGNELCQLLTVQLTFVVNWD